MAAADNGGAYRSAVGLLHTGNENTDELFQSIFPDSEIGITFKCGEDKTAYIA